MNRIFAFCAAFLISYTARAQAPANDNCSNAVILSPSTNSVCAATTAGTTVAATASAIPDCNAQISVDVWYKFVATQTYHKIVVRNASPSYLISLQFFTSTNGTCSNLVSKGCTSNNGLGDSTTYKAYNLTIGETYFVKVFTPVNYTQTTTFNICITSPPTNIPKPVNDSCQNATILFPSSNPACTQVTSGTCVGATPGVIDCYSRQSDDVWYKFQATANHHKVIVKGIDFLSNGGILEYRSDECNMFTYYGDCVTRFQGDSMIYKMNNLTIGNWYYFRVTTDADDPNRAFTICVTTPELPPNDECVDAQILLTHQQWTPTVGTTVSATRGLNFNSDCNSNYINDVWYKFVATNSSHEIRVKGQGFVDNSGNIQFFTGTCNSLISVACTSTYSGDSIVYNASGLITGETYFFQVYAPTYINYEAPFEVCVLSNNDDCETAESVVLNTDYRCLTVTAGSTSNTTASTQSVCTGTADDDKWYKFTATGTSLNIKLTPAAANGIDNAVMEIFSGNCPALNSLYCVNNTTGANAEEQLTTGLTIGNTYYVRVYSFDDNIGKGDFELCISSPVPVNDECAGAIQLVPANELVCTNPTSGSTIGATASGQSTCNGSADDDVWYKFTAIAPKQLITLTPDAISGINSAVVELYSGDCSSLSSIYCFTGSGAGILQYDANGFTVGNTYYLRVHSYDDNFGNGDFTLCVSTHNEVCKGAQTLTVNPGTLCSTVTNGTTIINGTGLPSCIGTSDDELWYKFTAIASAHRIKVTPSATNGINNVVLEVLSGDCSAPNNLYCVNSTSGSAPEEILATNLIVGSTYFVRVYSYASFSDAGDFEICVTTPAPLPANDNCIGAVTLIVTASTTCTSPVTGTTLNATQSMAACNATTTTYSDDDVWYKFTAIGNTTHFDISPVGVNGLFDPVMQLFQTNDCGTIGSIGSSCYDNLPGTGATSFRTYTTPGAVYYLRIYSAGNGTGQGDFTICTYYDGPPNDDCSGAINVPVNNDNSCTLTTAGTTLNATSSNAPPGCTNQLGGTADDDVWYKFTATAATHIVTVTPTVVGGIDNVVLRIYDGNCSNFTYNTCINNTTGANAETYTAENLVIGNTYYFSVHSYINSYNGTGQGAFTICINKTVVNDECTGAINIPVNDNATCTNTYQGTTIGSSNSPGQVGCGSSDVWYKFVASSTAYNIGVTPTVSGGIPSPVLELISGTCSSLTSLGCRNQTSTYENLTIGDTYYLRVGNGNSASQGAFSICIKSLSNLSSNTDYYRSITSGNWNSPATWESAATSNFSTGLASPATLVPDQNASGVQIINAHTVTVSSDLTIDKTFVNPGGTLVVTGATLTVLNNGLTFQSAAAGTGRIGTSTGTISGNVNVERFIPAGKRAYRQLASGVNTVSDIRTNWQNGGSFLPGKGIYITGSTVSANGFDATQTGNPSMFTYTPGGTIFTPIPGTNGSNKLNALQGYRVFVIGDRNANLTIANNTGTGTRNIALNSPTTLSATGTVVTGTVTYNKDGATAFGSTDATVKLGAIAGQFALIGNPYWSPVDFDLLAKSDVLPTYWIWDPTIGNRGAYVSWTTSTGSSLPGSSAMTKDIQPGQAIFIQNTTTGFSGNPSLTFEESNKTAINTNTFRSPTQSPSKISIQLFTNTSLVNSSTSQDGAVAAFRDDFTKAIGNEDAPKFTNSDENIAIVNGVKTLGIDARPTVASIDTMPVRIWQLYGNNQYTLKLVGSNFDAGMSAELLDKYLHTSTQLDMAGVTTYPFSFTVSDSASYYNRFFIVVSAPIVLPVNSISVNAYRKNNGIQVGWNIATETNVDRYEIERSADSRLFKKAGSVNAKANNNLAVGYNWFDADLLYGEVYYRIKAISKSGEIQYSEIVKVRILKDGLIVIVSPNPVHDGAFQLQMINLKEGKYSIILYSNAGQQVYSEQFTATGIGFSKKISPQQKLASGVYSLVIKEQNGRVYQQKIVFEK